MTRQPHMQISVKPSASLRQVIGTIEAGSIQIALVLDETGRLLGTVTDGDIRRGILRGVGLDEEVSQVMNAHPVTAPADTTPDDLLALMTSRSIKQVPLLDGEGRVVALERLDNLLRGPATKNNPVIILAGGLGTRLQPLTNHTPKPLLTVGDRPVLELIVNQLRAYGFHKFYISVNHLADRIEEYFADGKRHGVSIQYLREPEPLGTAGPLALMAKPVAMPCIVVNGDLLTKVSFENMLAFHSEAGFDLTIAVKEYSFELPFGVVVTNGDRVVEFQEKPSETRLINAGVYVLDPDVLDMVPQKAHYDMDQLIERVLADPAKQVGAFFIHEYWMDIGTVADYHRAQRDYQVHFSE